MKPLVEPVVLNGGYGEGGGALLRTALVMSALLQRPLRLHNIRGATRKRGLNPEDCCLIDGLAHLTKADVKGGTLDSEEVTFTPTRPTRATPLRLDVRSYIEGRVPGNSLIVVQSLLPVLAKSQAYARVIVMGETHSNNTLCFDALEKGTLAAHRAQGLYAFPSLVTTGFGYGSHGEVAIEVEPSALEPLDWKLRGELVEAGATLCATNMAPEALERASILLGQALQEQSLGQEIEIHEVHGRETGASVTFWAHYERGIGTGSATMQRGMTLNQTISRAWDNFEKWYKSSATVDAFLADQILIPATLCEGKTTFTTPEVTRRLTTMAWVIKQFLPIHITILGREGEPGTVTIER